MPAWMTYVHGADDARFARFAPILVKTLNLGGNTLGAFRPLAEADVEAIYRLCL